LAQGAGEGSTVEKFVSGGRAVKNAAQGRRMGGTGDEA
jgi:hypothetical protein